MWYFGIEVEIFWQGYFGFVSCFVLYERDGSFRLYMTDTGGQDWIIVYSKRISDKNYHFVDLWDIENCHLVEIGDYHRQKRPDLQDVGGFQPADTPWQSGTT